MLLVLIAVGMASILTTAYLASRDNSTVVSTNVARTAAARWASLAGLELATAILETEADWRTRHTNGRLLDDYDLAGATIDVDVLDAATRLPPTSGTTEVDITVAATMDGVTQVTTARATVVPPRLAQSIDVDLSEFAIYSRNGVELRDLALVSRWTTAPLAPATM